MSVTTPVDVQPGAEQDERAIEHRSRALEALVDSQAPHIVLAHALLAVEARLEELTCFVAQLS